MGFDRNDIKFAWDFLFKHSVLYLNKLNPNTWTRERLPQIIQTQAAFLSGELGFKVSLKLCVYLFIFIYFVFGFVFVCFIGGQTWSSFDCGEEHGLGRMSDYWAEIWRVPTGLCKTFCFIHHDWNLKNQGWALGVKK